jgi:hypothetical protein
LPPQPFVQHQPYTSPSPSNIFAKKKRQLRILKVTSINLVIAVAPLPPDSLNTPHSLKDDFYSL